MLMFYSAIFFACTIAATYQQDQTLDRAVREALGPLIHIRSTAHSHNQAGVTPKSHHHGKSSHHQKLPTVDEWGKRLAKDLATLMTKSEQPYATYLKLWRARKNKENRKSSTYDEEKVHFFDYLTKVNKKFERKIATAIGLPAEAAARAPQGPGASSGPLSIQDQGRAMQNLGSNAGQVTAKQPIPDASAAQKGSAAAVGNAAPAAAQATSAPLSGIAGESAAAITQQSAAATSEQSKKDAKEAPGGKGPVAGAGSSGASPVPSAAPVVSDNGPQPTAGNGQQSAAASSGRLKRELRRKSVPRVMSPEFTIAPPDPSAVPESESAPRPMGK